MGPLPRSRVLSKKSEPYPEFVPIASPFPVEKMDVEGRERISSLKKVYQYRAFNHSVQGFLIPESMGVVPIV